MIRPFRSIAPLTLVVAAAVAWLVLSVAASSPQEISRKNWGQVVGPVFGSSSPERGGAERFAGPNQFDGGYDHGVLPDGRMVRPAGTVAQVGMTPLGAALTPDGRFLVTSNDNDDSGTLVSSRNPLNAAGYSLSVVDTQTMKVVSQINKAGRFFIGIEITGTGPYTVWASGAGDNDVKRFSLSTEGVLTAQGRVAIAPISPRDTGLASHYVPDPAFDRANEAGDRPPVPTNFNRRTGAATTFPAGMALSPDGRFLYVACNGDNSLAVIDTSTSAVVRQVGVGYFPYGVVISADGRWAFVSNWGVTEYRFANPGYGPDGTLRSLAPLPGNQPAGFFVPRTDTGGLTPRTSSISIVALPGGDGARAHVVQALHVGSRLDELNQVGDTHPSAMALVRRGPQDYLYVTQANSDRLAVLRLRATASGGGADSLSAQRLRDVDLSPIRVSGVTPPIMGTTPNAIVASPDGSRLYVAEAGLNSVAVLDARKPDRPTVMGRIPTGWYPTALQLDHQGRALYVVNAKGIAEDIPGAGLSAPPSKVVNPAGALARVDSNFIFGSVQRVDLATWTPDASSVLAYNFARAPIVDTRIVPAGGGPSKRIKHVFFILHENKTFDSMLGNLTHLGGFASITYRDSTGASFSDPQYTEVARNLQQLASRFAVAVNYYSDAEESDAGHQFAASGTITDYSEKTLNDKAGRGLLTNKNMDAEDYPASGYIFNNAARHGVSFKDYGALVRITGTDTGASTPTTLNDPPSGKAGLPLLPLTAPPANTGDVDSPVAGLGQSYFLDGPVLAILGGKNANGEPRLDRNYPGYNFNISDQRRAAEFCRDFDRMAAAGTVPQFLYIYQPNDHTGTVAARNLAERTPAMQVADGDIALGMVVEHIMRSPLYYDPKTGDGSAIFITFDDPQSTFDHIHPHRTPLVVVSPYAKPGPATRHYSTASIVKTEELLLGLPPNNLGDLTATDLRDMFQPTYNGVTVDQLAFTRRYSYAASEEGIPIWALAARLDITGPDRDSRKLGAIARLSMLADRLHDEAARTRTLGDLDYRRRRTRCSIWQRRWRRTTTMIDGER